MNGKKIDKTVIEESIVCSHNFIITKWTTRGGMQSASMARCAHCLLEINLEELESKEWSQKQGFK